MGTVFEVAKGSGTITALASFNGTNGENPYGALVMDSSGNLYGTDWQGGGSDDGTVFELAKGQHTIDAVASFNGSNGSNPQAGLIMDSSGNLYGTAQDGGANGYGAIFEVVKGSKAITDLASFSPSTDGAYPQFGGLVMDSSGNFYGTTSEGFNQGVGTVFELYAHTPALNWNFPAAITYGTALSSTQLDASATDSGSGAAVAGTYAYTPAAGTILPVGSHTLTVTFTSTNTAEYSPITVSTTIEVNQATPMLTWNTPAPIPYGTPLSSTQLDATATNPNNGSPVSGTFTYTPPAGTVLARGSTILNVTFVPSDTTDYTTPNQASVTLVVTPSYSLSTLASVTGGPNGEYPHAGLIMDSSGDLYGTTEGAGTGDNGTVFELAKGSGAITTLALFNGTNGANPYGGLIMDSSGNMYGTASDGGASKDGTVFEVAKGSGTITALASFNGTNGANPHGGLILDSSGNLYGTTEFGGASMDGTVFEVAKGSGTITTLASFNGINGADPVAGLIMDGSGNLYGTAESGHFRTVFELAKGSSTITVLARFNGTNGDNPEAGLILDSSGNLYGTTSGGGASGDGTVFELAKGSGTITALASFNGANGANPVAGLIMDGSGNLYGTTESGGANGDGTVFAIGGRQPHHHDRGVVRRLQWILSTRRSDHGQRRQSLWHDRVGRRLQRGHGFRAARSRHSHRHRQLLEVGHDDRRELDRGLRFAGL